MAVTINIPSQVKTYANLAAFPASGSLKTIYIAEDTNKTYRWDGSTYVEISASAATGLTVGTTPIASGTIGRVLFQGTGNVLQQSGNLFWDGTNNRLGIGTSTPTSVVEINHNPTGINNTTGLILNNGLAGSTLKSIIFNSGTTERGTFGVHNGSGEFRWGISSGGYFPTIYANGSERLRINTTGNVLINTTTDAGFKLDVNGTARVQDNLLLTNGIIATSTATTRLQGSLNYFTHNRIGSSGALGFQISQTSTLSSFWRWTDATNDVEFGNARNASLSLWTNNTVKATITGGGNVLINTTTDAGFRLDVNGTARVNTLTIGLGTGQVSTNTAIGSSALLTNTTGSENTAVGFDALRANTTGQSNVAVGRNAMTSNTTGGNNASFGRFALRNNTTGTANTSLGNSAMNDNTTGGFNIGIGSNSLVTNTSGSNNIGIGANCSSGNFDASIILGRDATATASNQFVVGSTTYNAGSVTTEVNTSTQVWNVVINGVARKILLA